MHDASFPSLATSIPDSLSGNTPSKTQTYTFSLQILSLGSHQSHLKSSHMRVRVADVLACQPQMRQRLLQAETEQIPFTLYDEVLGISCN